jgi:hypothetical protein
VFVVWRRSCTEGALALTVCGQPALLGRMRKAKDGELRDFGIQSSSKGQTGALSGKSWPRLLEAAAVCEGYMAPPKRSRSAAGPDGQSGAAGKRRRVVKVEASENDGEQDGAQAPKSQFLGVHWNKCKKKWRVRIKIAGRDTHVGYFAEEAEAALAFDR